MKYQTVTKYDKKRVLLFLNNEKEHLCKICDVTFENILIEEVTDTSDSYKTRIPLVNIKKIVPKDNVLFIRPKYVLTPETDAAVTRHIETIKKEGEYALQTRKYKLQINGSRKRSKWSTRDFEKSVAKWLTPDHTIEVCPFALVKIKKEEFLLAVGRDKKLKKIAKNGTTVLV